MKPFPKEIPETAIIKTAMERIDYTDNYSIIVPKSKAPALEKMPLLFFTCMPSWFRVLMYLREGIAKVIRLKTAIALDIPHQMREFSGAVGESIAIFHVIGRSNTEIMMGENDSHLDFRLSFLRYDRGEEVEIMLATTVQYNNWLGKVYFFPVKPFHKIIVQILLRKMVR